VIELTGPASCCTRNRRYGTRIRAVSRRCLLPRREMEAFHPRPVLAIGRGGGGGWGGGGGSIEVGPSAGRIEQATCSRRREYDSGVEDITFSPRLRRVRDGWTVPERGGAADADGFVPGFVSVAAGCGRGWHGTGPAGNRRVRDAEYWEQKRAKLPAFRTAVLVAVPKRSLRAQGQDALPDDVIVYGTNRHGAVIAGVNRTSRLFSANGKRGRRHAALTLRAARDAGPGRRWPA